MALPSLIVEEKKDEAKPPSNEELLAQERAERQKLEQQMREREAAYQARMEQFERDVSSRFAAVRQNATPEVNQAYQAAEELGLTDEEITARPAEAIKKIAEHIALKKVNEYNQQISPVLSGLAYTSFQSQVNELKSHPFFQDLESLLVEHFNQNPQEAMVAGRPKKIFNELIGEHLDELNRRQAERKGQSKDVETQEQVKAAPPPSIRTSGPIAPVESKKSERAPDPLDPIREELIKAFAPFGANLSMDEWMGIEEGRLLPKKVAADIQIGKRKPNVEYES